MTTVSFILTFGTCPLSIGIVKKVSRAKKSMMGKRSHPVPEEEIAIIPTKRNMEEKRKVLIGTGCSSAIYLMT